MDDLEKHASSYQQDQEILDARGINMTVEEVAGLPTAKYSEKVQALQLNEEDLSFLKGLRRRIKNRVLMHRKDPYTYSHCAILNPQISARGINMTVEEVAGLPTAKYSEKVQALQLNEEDLSFLKGLRRRIKNRLASQNSRRRSLEHLRRLTRELRAVRARRDDALSERRALLRRRDAARDRCRVLRLHVAQVLQERSDPSPIPNLDDIESQQSKEIKRSRSPDLSESYRDQSETYRDKSETYRDKKETFECRIEKLVQKSVNHIFEKKKVSAKTVFLDESNRYFDNREVFIKEEPAFIKENGFMKEESFIKEELGCKVLREENGGVLDLCVKEKRRSHGRKQSAPRRIAYVDDYNDMVLDLKIKKENQ